MDSRKKAKFILELVRSKKGKTPVILDLRRLTDIADYFLITSADSSRHIKAVVDGLVEGLNKKGLKISHIEGAPDGGWVVLDCGDNVAHIFNKELRRFYNLEKLWADAPRVRVWRRKTRVLKKN